jgi:hypothetical protein
LADLLWALGLNGRALLEDQGRAIYRRDRVRCFQPLWLFDGLDELCPPPGEQFYQALVNLPGLKVLSCRTAVYETPRWEADRYKDQEYELLGLKPLDQRRFLTHALSGVPTALRPCMKIFSVMLSCVCSPATRSCSASLPRSQTT